MDSITIALMLFAGCAVAGLLGLALRPRLAEHHLDSESRAVVTNITGLIAAMSALLLGLLVANAQSSYNTVSDEVDQMAANLVELDRTLRGFGPAAAEPRALLRQVAQAEVDRIWPPEGGARADALDPGASDEQRLRFGALLGALPTGTDAQRAMQRHALELVAANSRMRVLLFNQLNNELPVPVVAVVSFWLVTLFLAFGLLARFNAVVVIALLIGGASVGGAMFLVLELNRPFGGVMQVDDGSVRAALALMGR